MDSHPSRTAAVTASAAQTEVFDHTEVTGREQGERLVV
jgi:hypothetical protein